MKKQHFYLKLIGPRPTFPQDMSELERTLMQQHAVYTQKYFDAGRILIYGPVLAASGAFGMAVFEVESESEVRAILENDPSVLAGMNTFELYPMRVADARGKG
jgi:uncharacterized protein YciI